MLTVNVNLSWIGAIFPLCVTASAKLSSQISSICGNHPMDIEPEKGPCRALIVKSFLEYSLVQTSSAAIGSYSLLKAASFVWKTKTLSTAC